MIPISWIWDWALFRVPTTKAMLVVGVLVYLSAQLRMSQQWYMQFLVKTSNRPWVPFAWLTVILKASSNPSLNHFVSLSCHGQELLHMNSHNTLLLILDNCIIHSLSMVWGMWGMIDEKLQKYYSGSQIYQAGYWEVVWRRLSEIHFWTDCCHC